MRGSFRWFKYGIYSLLALNIYLFFRHTTFHEGLDCLAWFLLLTVFEYETNPQLQARLPALTRHAAQPFQLVAIGCILYADARYYTQGQWLDLINGCVWLLVLISLELDIYLSKANAKLARRWHAALKILLYTSLVIIAVAWGIIGDPLNFYDAMLWVVCFFFIELNLFNIDSTE